MTERVYAGEAIEAWPAVRGTPVPPEPPEPLLEAMRKTAAAAEGKDRKLVIFAWSGDLDRVWPTLILATSGAAMGMQTTVFFTFWGLFPLVTNAHAAQRKGRGRGEDKATSSPRSGAKSALVTARLGWLRFSSNSGIGIRQSRSNPPFASVTAT